MRFAVLLLLSTLVHVGLLRSVKTPPRPVVAPAARPLLAEFFERTQPPSPRESPPPARRAPARRGPTVPAAASVSATEQARGPEVVPAATPLLVFQVQGLSTRPGGDARGGGRRGAPWPGEAFNEARVLSLPRVEYPAAARLDGASGVVRLWVELDERGAVSSVKVRASDDPRLEEAAREALLHATFSPARRGATPVPTAFEYVYRFELSD